MLSLNKYLRELGINEKTWPFNEMIENENHFNKGEPCDARYVAAAPLNDGRVIENFVHAQFFNLDNTISMIIYSHLCYFKEFVSHYKDEEFNKILDIIIEGFRLSIDTSSTEISKRKNRKIRRAWKLLADNYSRLWY